MDFLHGGMIKTRQRVFTHPHSFFSLKHEHCRRWSSAWFYVQLSQCQRAYSRPCHCCLKSTSQRSIQIPLTLKGIWVSKTINCLWKSWIRKRMHSLRFPVQASHIFFISQTESVPRNRLNDLHKASQEAKTRDENCLQHILGNTGSEFWHSILPLSQSKEQHWHSLIRRKLYIPASILNIRKVVCSLDGL